MRVGGPKGLTKAPLFAKIADERMLACCTPASGSMTAWTRRQCTWTI